MDPASSAGIVLSAPTIIYDLVVDCLNLFEQLASRNINGRVYFRVDAAEKSYDTTLDTVEAIRTLLKRFEIWTSYTGAVADNPDLSLDTRLGLDWKTRSMVVGLLHSIQISLQQSHAPSPRKEQRNNIFMSKSSAGATSIQNIDVVLKNLREAIDNLVALGKDVGSNTHVPVRAEDLDFEQDTTRLLRQIFNSARRTLLEQVAATITERRRRILYITRHLGKMRERVEDGLEDPGTFTCQFCPVSLEGCSTIYRQKHLDEHLQPYVCLSEECSPSFLYFPRFQLWINHMNEFHTEEWPRLIHTSTWFCDVEHPNPMTFDDQESFETHMCDTLLHPRGSRPSDRQLATLSRRKRKSMPRKPNVCPFCEKAYPTWSDLYEHIGEHLQSVARLSRPALEDQASEGNENGSWSSSLSVSIGDDDDQELWTRSSVLMGTEQSLSFNDPPDVALSDTKDKEIPDINKEEPSRLLSGIFSSKLENVDPLVISKFQNTRDHHVASQALRTRIAKAKIMSAMDHRAFVPESSIHGLVTEESIELELSQPGLPLKSVSQFILSKASKIFAILVYIKMAKYIEEFWIEDLSDEVLPVAIPGIPALELSVFNSWDYDNVSDFYESQWLFLAPIFTKEKFVYELDDACPLPFTTINPLSEKMSAFSIVQEVTIHPGHQSIIPPQQNSLPSVAVKQLRPEREKSDDELATEVAINSLHHPHLMKALAAYKRHGKQCLIFPWATGGNLRETWAQLDNHKFRNAKLVPWVVRQLYGLSAALETLHERNWRHGDLKPRNILRFKDGNGLGTLVIADMGLAKFHREITEFRDHTSNRFGTFRYESPESTLSSRLPVSRRSDIWSFGCIVIEFVVWLLYGVDELERFDGAFTSFFVADYPHSHKGPRKVIINPVVVHWIKHMMTHDPRCQERSVLRDVLKLVKSRLLVVESPPKEKQKAKETQHEMKWVESEVPRIIIHQASDPETLKALVQNTATEDTEQNAQSKGRADSKELCSRLQEISKKIELEGEGYLQESSWGAVSNFTGPRDDDARVLLNQASETPPREYLKIEEEESDRVSLALAGAGGWCGVSQSSFLPFD